MAPSAAKHIVNKQMDDNRQSLKTKSSIELTLLLKFVSMSLYVLIIPPGFEELTCHCGAQTMEPPIPCGATPPPCDYPCARYHQCDHPVRHTCHNDSQCPPCVELTSKYCFGKHEVNALFFPLICP